MKVGRKIIEFDNAEDNSYKAFSDIFKVTLDVPEKSTVEILGITTGGLRVVRIDELDYLADLCKPVEKVHKRRRKQYYE